MSASDPGELRDGPKVQRVRQNGSSDNEDALTRADHGLESKEWADRLADARARRAEALQQRSKTAATQRLVRPEARPPPVLMTEALGDDPELAPSFDTRSAPLTERLSRGVSPSEPPPETLQPATSRPDGQPVATGVSEAVGRTSPAPDVPTSPVRFDRGGGQLVLAAFALGLGLGIPLATTAWFLNTGSERVTKGIASTDGPAKTSLETSMSVPVVSELGKPPRNTATSAPNAAPEGPSDILPPDLGVLLPPPAAIPHSAPVSLRAAPLQAPGPPKDAGLDDRQATAQIATPVPVPAADLHPDEPAKTLADTVPLQQMAPTVVPAGSPFVDVPVADDNDMLPDGVGQVYIYAPRRAPRDRANEVVTTLRDAGASVRAPTTTAATIRQTHIRYYHAEDAEAARAAAKIIGADARDFTNYAPSPPVGMLEVWIAGTGAPKVTSRASSGGDSVRGLGQAVKRLFRSIPPSQPR